MHKCHNGYLVSFKMVETWTICVIMLEDAKILYQKFH